MHPFGLAKNNIHLGLFDSGLGGMVVLESFKKIFPEMDIFVEMDRSNLPYGDKTPEEIRSFTKDGVQRLFDRGANVVILACNTASVHALRWLQQEVFPEKHILGVVIPGAERIVEAGYKKVGVLATQATVNIRGYRERVYILDASIELEEVGTTGIVPAIESGIFSGEKMEGLIRPYLQKFSPEIEALVLGCTHYPLIRETIGEVWKNLHPTSKIEIIDPGEEAAKKFQSWIERKKEFILK